MWYLEMDKFFFGHKNDISFLRLFIIQSDLVIEYQLLTSKIIGLTAYHRWSVCKASCPLGQAA